MAHHFIVDEQSAGERLDIYLTKCVTDLSRAHIQRAIEAGGVQVDGQLPKPSLRLETGQQVSFTDLQPQRDGPQPEPIPLDILFEDDYLAAVNKPAGMVVHPGRGNWRGTLAAALAHHFDQLSRCAGEIRPGIVHRLDRETSGVLVVAKSDQVHEALAQQFKARSVVKEYLALVAGVPDRDRDVIQRPIGAHPTSREKMAIRADHHTSKEAETFYEVVERYGRFALLQCTPKTGRTHQIRLHLLSVRCPVLCDRLYGGRSKLCRLEVHRAIHPVSAEHNQPHAPEEILLGRQGLHAHRLSIDHPQTGERLQFESPLPEDMQRTITALREATAST